MGLLFDFQKERKELNNRRLDLDAARNKLKKTSKDDPKLYVSAIIIPPSSVISFHRVRLFFNLGSGGESGKRLPSSQLGVWATSGNHEAPVGGCGRLSGMLRRYMSEWLIDWLTVWLIDWLIDWLRLIDWLLLRRFHGGQEVANGRVLPPQYDGRGQIRTVPWK